MGVAEIAVIGGSGFYELFPEGRELLIGSPYGATSDVVTVGELAGKSVAFIPRHGQRHHLPAHKVPYRANLYTLRELGVKMVLGVSASGALVPEYRTGDFVIGDQLVDWTHGTRDDTFFDGPLTTHIDFSEPYCPQLRETTISTADRLGTEIHTRGTTVVTPGPRFSTRAESEYFMRQGWQLENMTQYPEAVLARELGLSYANIAVVTNNHRDEPLPEGAGGGLAQAIVAVFERRLPELLALVAGIIEDAPPAEQRPEMVRHAVRDGRLA
jgi:5'-methylthioadenosine phosphorylase